MIDLSIVTGARNRPASFERLVNSIERHAIVDWELVVSDASDAPLTCDDRRVRILPERPRLGCTKGYNRAFREARGKWVLWVNDDCEVLPGFDTAAIRFMVENPAIGLGALYYREGARDFHVNSYFSMLYANFGIIRRTLGEGVGWWDEDFEMYGNDNSFALRILMAGFGVTGIDSARLVHHSENDAERAGNNDPIVRRRAVDLLLEKYRGLFPRLRETYLQCGGVLNPDDQTPYYARIDG